MDKKEKKEKEEKKGIAATVGLHPRVQSMLDAINEVPEAREALRSLVRNGCDRSVILTNLFFYCGGTAEELRVGLKNALDFRDRLGWVSNRLVEDAAWVEEMTEKCIKYRTPIYGLSDLPATLRSFAEMLSTVGTAYRRGLKNVRLGNKDTRKGKERSKSRMNPTAGRTQHLVYLAYYVKGLGDLPRSRHFQLLARLVAAVLNDQRPILRVADGLRNAVAAFVKRRPFLASVIGVEAEAEFEEKIPT
jgi:hypothetical protein